MPTLFIAVALSIWSVYAADGQGGPLTGMVVFALVVFLAPSVALILFAFRVVLVVDDDGIDVTTMFQQRRILWTDIRGVEADRSGVKLALGDGSYFQTGALYGPSWSSLFGRSDSADALVETISARADLDSVVASGAVPTQ